MRPRQVGSTWTYFLLDGASVVKEITGTTSVHTTQGPLIDQPLARNGRTFTVNHQGSTTTLTDGTGVVVQSYSYGPFGETTQSTGEVNPFQYAGRENDGATGLYYHRARYYRPEWGRFLSADPIGFAGGLNHYLYTGNNPLNGVDPTGTTPAAPTGAGEPPENVPLSEFVQWFLQNPKEGFLRFDRNLRITLETLAGYGQAILQSALAGPDLGPMPIGIGAIDPNRTVADILKDKKGSIRNAPLPKGSPSWDDILDLTYGQIERRAQLNLPEYKAIKKLLTDKRFDK